MSGPAHSDGRTDILTGGKVEGHFLAFGRASDCIWTAL